MQHFNLLTLQNVPIYKQLQIEEALLRTHTQNWCIVNHGSPPAIVMGISGKTEELIHQQEAASKQIPIIKRFTGGGTVIVDEKTIFITWIANSEQIGVPCCPKKVLEWTTSLYKPIFQGIDFKLMENDYAIGLKKCGGNAQYFRKNRWLHHTSFLWDYCPHHMSLLKMPPKMPSYRESRKHADFLCCLKDHFATKNVFLDGLIKNLHHAVDMKAFSTAGLNSLLDIPHRRSLTYI